MYLSSFRQSALPTKNPDENSKHDNDHTDWCCIGRSQRLNMLLSVVQINWQNYTNKTKQQLGDDFTAAVELSNEEDIDAALLALDRIVDKGSDGTLANMSSKSLLLSNN